MALHPVILPGPEEEVAAALRRFCGFCFPQGQALARKVHTVELTEQGEMRASPEARWIPFTAREVIETPRSSFRWDAHYRGGSQGLVTVTEGCVNGRGYAAVNLGTLPIKDGQGPDLDKGEIQRYLASVMLCPPVILNHQSLDWEPAGPFVLRLRDSKDPTRSTVDLDLSEEGWPLACHALRPMGMGKRVVLTPWSGVCAETRDWDGIRAASRLEVFWHLPEGPFAYFRSEVTAFKVLN